MQTKDDGTHVILPVAGRRMAPSDHAGLPVMMPRESDGEMRHDGSSAADVQPKHPVAERGRVHGVPDFSSGEALRIAAKREVVLSSEKDKRRWRQRARDPDRLRGQDKRTWHYVAHVLEIIAVCTLFRWCASGTPIFTPLLPQFRAKPWLCWFSAGTKAAERAIFGSFGRTQP